MQDVVMARVEEGVVCAEMARRGQVVNPATGEIIRHVAFADEAAVEQAVVKAKAAFPEWAAKPAATRGRILAKFYALIEENEDRLAELVSEEHGKSLAESKGSIARGLDVLEFASGISSHLKGDFTENIGRKIDSYAVRQPLGVCVGITPFNFPVMVALWTSSVALACGNTFILKPSERNPSAAELLGELALEAGMPEGVFSVVNGDKEAVNALLVHDDVEAVTFIGQTSTAKYIQKTAIAHGKRVQAFGGAKNHMVVMPDADVNQTVNALLGAGYGSAGERCMAISVAVIVGDEMADKVVGQLAEKVKNLKIGPYTDPEAEMGPLITAEHLKRVKGFVDTGVEEAAELVVDGRQFEVPMFEGGHFMGGCLFDHVTPDMQIYKEEIFGPVLCVVRVKTYEEALHLASSHPYGNGVAIFTRDGDCARDFSQRVQVGMVGVNVPIPVPAGHYSFGGWKQSAFADIGMHGMEGVRFYTKMKTVTSRWPSGVREGVEFSLMTTERS